MISETTKKRNRLFAKLICDEAVNQWVEGGRNAGSAYLSFLKAQRSNALFDPYTLAVKALEAR